MKFPNSFDLAHPSDAYEQFLRSSGNGVFYVGHASILVRLNGRKILFDPVCQRPPYLESWYFFPPQVMDPRLVAVDAVVVSHAHEDHFDPEFLRKLDKSVPVFIVEGRPEFEAVLRREGLRTTVIRAGRSCELFDGVHAFGVLHESNSVDSSMAVYNENFGVYHGNDNYVEPRTLKPLREAASHIDVACIPFAYINWYPFLLDGVDPEWRDHEARRLVEHYFQLCVEQAEVLAADVVVPFGSNLVYHDEPDSAMNRAVASPLDFKRYVDERAVQRADSYRALYAGDYVTKCGRELRIVQKRRTEAEQRAELAEFLDDKRRQRSYEDVAEVDQNLVHDLGWLTERLGLAGAPTMDHRIYVESSGSRSVGVEIDLEAHVARPLVREAMRAPFHRLIVQPTALAPWLRQEIGLQAVIGTRRFRMERVPNIYDRDVLRLVMTTL